MKLTAKIIPALALMALTAASCSKKAEITLITDTVTSGPISESVTATGTLESETTVDVGTQVTGIIDKIYVDYNSEVKQGDLIAEIEKVLLESELASAEAAVESARASYEYAKTNHERDTRLHDRQLISDYEYDTSVRDFEVARTAYEKSQAERVRAAKNLKYAEIYSPIDGIVISRDVEVGQTVVSSMTVANLFTIADLNHMRVVADVDEADIGSVEEGQTVTFTVDAYPDRVFEGIVTQKRINPTTESNVVTYEVLVSTTNDDHKLIPGLTANLTIYKSREADALLVPVKATRFLPRDTEEPVEPFAGEADQKRVWLAGADGSLTPRIITVGASDGVNFQVLSGLEKGDRVAMEYTAAMTEEPEGETARSPFAPKPPSRKK